MAERPIGWSRLVPHAIAIVVLAMGSVQRVHGATGTVLYVVVNSASMDTQERARKTLMEGWGYTVVPISDSASQAAFDAAVLTSSVAYICETALSGNVSTKLTNATIGVITEESALSDEFGIAGSMTTITDYRVNIVNTTHFITSGMSAGMHSLFTGAQPLRYLSGTQGGYTELGRAPTTADKTFVVMERGATLTPSGAAVGRRVYLPWGNTGVDINALTADGLTIMQRSIAWCMLPVSQWKLDDASGSTAVDSVGGRNGTLVSATWTNGWISGGALCAGTSSYIEVPNATAFQMTQALSVTGWMRCDGDSTWPTGSVTSPLVRKGVAEPSNYAVQVADGKLAMYLDDVDTAGIRGNTTLTTGQWYHLAATWDGAKVRLYVNGVLDNTATTRAAPIGSDTRVLNIGGRSGGERFNGKLDDVRLYERCLTPEEILAIKLEHRPRVTSWRELAPGS